MSNNVGLHGEAELVAAERFVGSRTIANIQAGYKAESWEINAFAENVLDERYFTYMDDNAYATVGPGRTVGLNVKARF